MKNCIQCGGILTNGQELFCDFYDCTIRRYSVASTKKKIIWEIENEQAEQKQLCFHGFKSNKKDTTIMSDVLFNNKNIIIKKHYGYSIGNRKEFLYVWDIFFVCKKCHIIDDKTFPIETYDEWCDKIRDGYLCIEKKYRKGDYLFEIPKPIIEDVWKGED